MDLASSLEHKKILLYGIQLQTPKVSFCSAPLSRVDMLSTAVRHRTSNASNAATSAPPAGPRGLGEVGVEGV